MIFRKFQITPSLWEEFLIVSNLTSFLKVEDSKYILFSLWLG